MANTKTSGLTALTGAALDAGDYFPVLDSSASELKKVLASAISLTDSGKTASFNAAAGYHYRVDMNSAGADFVVTFPASPAIGDFFAYTLTRAHASWNLTIARNGNNVYAGTDVSLYTTKEAGHTSIWRWDSTTTGQGWIRMNEPKVNVQEFTANGTWVKPPGAIACIALLIGGGGGGGSGKRDAASSHRCGGGGGAASNPVLMFVPESAFGSTESVTIGSGGAGGSAITTNGTSGNIGTAGGDTTISNLKAVGGSAGAGGTGSAVAGGSYGTGATFYTANIMVAAGGFSDSYPFGGNGGSGGGSAGVLGGGGGGGGVNTGDFQFAGGAGGVPSGGFTTAVGGTAGATSGGAGGNGAAASSFDGQFQGAGGGGGGGGNAGVGGTGGNGGLYGAGGGGGGGCLNGNNSGAGGSGANGYARIITFCR